MVIPAMLKEAAIRRGVGCTAFNALLKEVISIVGVSSCIIFLKGKKRTKSMMMKSIMKDVTLFHSFAGPSMTFPPDKLSLSAIDFMVIFRVYKDYEGLNISF